jgi:hypothetical protein
MGELANLMRRIITEIQGLRQDIRAIGGPSGCTLEDVRDEIITFSADLMCGSSLQDVRDEVANVAANLTDASATDSLLRGITGKLGYNIEDIVDRVGTPSVFSLQDIWEKLNDVQSAIEAGQ